MDNKKKSLNEQEIEAYIKSMCFNVATGEYEIDNVNKSWLKKVANLPYDIQMQMIKSYIDSAMVMRHSIFPCLLRIIIIGAIIYGIVKLFL